jgi:hypothetical protein
MQVNMEKSSLYSWELSEQEKKNITHVLDLQVKDIGAGIKYLGFSLKANSYKKGDWL